MSHENLLVSSILNGTIFLVLLCWSIINIVVFSFIPKVNCLNSRFQPLRGNIKMLEKRFFGRQFPIHFSHDISHIFFISVYFAQSNSVCAKPLKQNSFIFAMGFTKRIIQSIDRLVSMYLFFLFFLFALFIGNDWVAWLSYTWAEVETTIEIQLDISFDLSLLRFVWTLIAATNANQL